MNIKEAKEQISNSIRAYFTKDQFGNYVIPIERQRPIFLMGPPGIGKTAIMEQISSELGVGLVSYSMTHHTRQSALGLPFIEKKIYGGEEYSVSEYTMSEIIASVYDMKEKTGVEEGILFLDEINCVSETLAPAMLQFLQYKIFGRHRVPDGWIVVTAGNPIEYNNSVREFDIVTWDRLKRIDVEADYTTWKEFAYKQGVHAAIITYLDIKKNDFYSVETSVDGKIFVTARGWCDLSDMIKLYEQRNLDVNEKLVSQYLQNKRIAKDFAIYYDLFKKYKSDYQIDKIISGDTPPEIIDRAKTARFDERLALLGLLLDAIFEKLNAINLDEHAQRELLGVLKTIQMELIRPNFTACDSIDKQIEALKLKIKNGKIASTLSSSAEYACNSTIAVLRDMRAAIENKKPANNKAAFEIMKDAFTKRTKEIKARAEAAKVSLSNVFTFCETTFGEGQELLIVVTELTVNTNSAQFIGRYGCDKYFAHNKDLLFHERQREILRELELLDLEDL